MRRAFARALALLTFSFALLLAGCAHAPRAGAPGSSFWSGRLALQIADRPDQSFSANFELQGNAESGELSLFSPLGSTVAVLTWAPGNALLRADGKTQRFESLDDLASQATGTVIPVAALFDWLAGVNTSVQGWHADLSQLGLGRLHAQRTQPAPAADLRIALEQP